jgi:hypothetical protein
MVFPFTSLFVDGSFFCFFVYGSELLLKKVKGDSAHGTGDGPLLWGGGPQHDGIHGALKP